MDWFLEPFALGVQQRALLGGLVAALMCSVVGVWLVLRGMSFFGDAFVHGVLPGIAAAIVLDFSPFIGAALAALVMVGGIELIHRQTRLKEDTAIGLLFVGMLALGVTIISKSRSYAGSLNSVLFGDSFGITDQMLVQQTVIAVVVVLAALVLYRPLVALSLSAAKARTLNMHPRVAHGMLLAMVALAVIGSFQAVGTLLVFGLLVGPPATAALLTRTMPQMFVVSVGFGAVSVWLGLTLSYHLGTAGEASMSLTAIIAFFLALLLTRVFHRTPAAVESEAD